MKKRIRVRFENIMKTLYSDLNLKIYYLGSGNNLYLIEYLSKYQVYFDYNFDETVYDNIRRCKKYMEFKIVDELIRRLEDE